MQINTGRAMKTVAEIRKIVDDNNIQVVAIQEPYTVKGKVSSFGSMARTISGEKKGERAWSAIVVFDPTLMVMRISQFCDSHITLSGYFQYSKPIGPYLARIDSIIRQLQGQKVVVCIDANARSPIWHSNDVSEEGELLENLIMELNLYVVNEPNNPKTYWRPGGEGNIDVTMVTETTFRTIEKWKVNEGWVSSDHNTITFELTSEVHRELDAELGIPAKFIAGKADWERFDKAFFRKAPQIEELRDKSEVTLLARKLRRALVEACKESMPVKGKAKVCAKWWSRELTTYA